MKAPKILSQSTILEAELAKTVSCPNQCPPEDLETEDWGGYKTPDHSVPAGRTYRCNNCGWEASWQLNQGLQVSFNPAVERQTIDEDLAEAIELSGEILDLN